MEGWRGVSVIILFVIVWSCGTTASKTASSKSLNYYQILEIESNATQREIRKAYFALVKLYHPDKNEEFEDSKKVREKFEEISNAYEILSDEEKRAEYDRLLQYGQKEYKPNQSQSTTGRQHTFKDPYKAYQEALQREADENFRETVLFYVRIVFVALFVVFLRYFRINNLYIFCEVFYQIISENSTPGN